MKLSQRAMMMTHIPTGKLFNWRYCVRCGLIYISNDVTRRAIQSGCDPRSVARRQGYQKGKK
jgi:hypothetical protein